MRLRRWDSNRGWGGARDWASVPGLVAASGRALASSGLARWWACPSSVHSACQCFVLKRMSTHPVWIRRKYRRGRMGGGQPLDYGRSPGGEAMKGLCVLAIACAALAIAVPARAQGGTSSTLSGVVVDAGGGVIPGADIIVRNDATG